MEDDFVAVKAHDFNRDQQNSTSRPQQVQHQSLGIDKFLQISISPKIWFGTMWSRASHKLLGHSKGHSLLPPARTSKDLAVAPGSANVIESKG